MIKKFLWVVLVLCTELESLLLISGCWGYYYYFIIVINLFNVGIENIKIMHVVKNSYS